LNNGLQSGSRSGNRAKRKKTNLILNSLIIIIIVIIVFVAYSIFSSGNNNASSKNDANNNSVKQSSSQKENNGAAKETSTSANDTNTSDSNTDTTNSTSSGDQQNGDTTSGSADESQAVVTEGGSSPNVEKTTENSDWKPVGTSQTGSHTPVYDTSSTDWKEMLNAISYATGLDQNNMIVWHLGRDRSVDNGSIGTVSSKDKKQKYNVYIQWVDGQGWKPTKVEQLTDNQNGN
jgi:cytoskeletal protein RodZ